MPRRRPTRSEIIEHARIAYASRDRVKIARRPRIERTKGGAWVVARVKVHFALVGASD